MSKSKPSKKLDINSGSWKVGGRNVDEDPHFSSYYHQLSTSPQSEYFNYQRLIALYKDFNEGYYIRDDIAEKVATKLMKKMLSDPLFFLTNDDLIRKYSDEIITYLNEFEEIEISDFKIAKDLYFKVSELTLGLYKYSRIPQCLDRSTNIFTDYLLSILKKSGSNNVMGDFSILTTPNELTLFQKASNERSKIKKIILENLNDLCVGIPLVHQYYFTINNDIRKMIEEYKNNYSHISYHGYGSRYKFSVKNFVDDLMKEDFDTGINPNSGLLHEELVRELGLSIKDQIIFMIYGRFGTTKMYRRFSQVRLFRFLDKIIMFLSIYWNIPEVYIRNLTYLELSQALELDKNPFEIFKDLKNRITGAAFCYDNGIISVYTGKEYEKIKESLNITGKKELLKGITAFHGNVVGIARKIYRNEDVFLKDEILISESTDPDLCDKIKIAKCVLTEQGGATSHACIICRELKVPCIVGIDGLLESINDGDLLEINTITGEIKKLADFKFICKNFDTNVSISLGGKFEGLKKLSAMGFGNFVPLTFALNTKNLNDVDKFDEIKSELEIVCRIINKQLAVRSSGQSEDSSEKSYAGQYRTLLNIEPNVDALLDALKKIDSHAKNIENIYDEETNQQKEFSIIIQPMFESKISGVLFSKNIISNNLDEIYLEYCDGLGENIVSGKVKPNILRFSRSTLEILEHTKNFDNGFVADKVFVELAKYCIQLSNKLKYAIDIEFGIKSDQQVAIFQMRPITT